MCVRPILVQLLGEIEQHENYTNIRHICGCCNNLRRLNELLRRDLYARSAFLFIGGSTDCVVDAAKFLKKLLGFVSAVG